MRRLAPGLIALLLLCGAASAAQPAAVPFLWRVQGARTQSYLLGSMHLLPASAKPLPRAIRQAYAKVDGVVFETDIGAMQRPAAQQAMLSAARRRSPLKTRIGAVLYQRVVARARGLGMPMRVCRDYAAWFCAVNLDVDVFRKAGFSNRYGVDAQLYAAARRDGKTIHGLEPVARQLALFTAMDATLSRDMLRAALDKSGDRLSQPRALYQAWRTDRLARFVTLDRQLRTRYPRLYRRLISDRNRAWMPQLKQLLDGARSRMIVVGAAHLVGPQGLVERLRKHGFHLVRVRSWRPAPAPGQYTARADAVTAPASGRIAR